MPRPQSKHARLFEAFDRLCDASEPEQREELRQLELEGSEFATELAAMLKIDGNTARPLTQEVRAHARRAIESQGSEDTATRPEDPMPERIGRFEIERRLGAGAMGVVYAGYDPTLHREVAVKVLAQGWSSEATLRRTRREAQAMAQLSHPNVVDVYGIGQHDGALYIVMERILGKTLAWWQQTPRSCEEILSVYRQAGLGLAELHARGLVHRDFKPANAMLGDDGRLRVLDLGLVREIPLEAESADPTDADTRPPDADTRLPTGFETESSAVMGTPAYMAPEQILGASAGPTADQFSFCVALFEALYGQRPFAAKTMPQLIVAITIGRIQTPGRSGVPRHVYKALCRGLAKEPEARHSSMEALLDKLTGRSPRTFLLSAAAVVAVVGALAPFGHSSADPACSLADGFDRVWTPSRQSALASTLPGEHAAAVRTNEYAAQLAETVDKACVAEAAASRACAAQLVARFDQVVQFLIESPPGLSAVDLAGSLPPTSSCDNSTEISIDVDAQALAEVAGEIQRAKALAFTSDLDAALDVANGALRRAQELGVASSTQLAFYQRGSVRSRRGEFDEAAADFSAAYQLAVARGDQRAIADLALAHVWIAKERQAMPDAEHWLRVASSAYEAQSTPDPFAHALLLLRRGEVAATRGDMKTARDTLRDAVKAWAPLDSPRNESTALSMLAWTEANVGELETAIEYAERAVSVLRNAAGPEDPGLATLHQNVGNLYQRAGNLQAAAEAFSEVVRLRKRSHGSDHLSTAIGQYALATALIDLERFEEARSLLVAARETAPEGHALRPACDVSLAMIASEEGNHEEALVRGNRALVVIDEQYGAEHPRAAEIRLNLAKFKLRAGDPAGALEDARAARSVFEDSFGPEHKAVETCLDHETSALRQLGRGDEVRPLLVRALELAVEGYGESSQRAGNIRGKLDALSHERGAIDTPQ